MIFVLVVRPLGGISLGKNARGPGLHERIELVPEGCAGGPLSVIDPVLSALDRAFVRSGLGREGFEVQEALRQWAPQSDSGQCKPGSVAATELGRRHGRELIVFVPSVGFHESILVSPKL